jgi:SHS2 domain-containing protein
MGNDVDIGHAFEDHTSEVRVRVWAPSLGALFEEAGRALGELMGEGATGAEGDAEEVEVEALDRDALLVDWLNELVYRTEMRGRLYTEIRVDRIGGQYLFAWVRGRPFPEGGVPVKAATYHGLSIEEGPRGFSAAVVVDV